MGLLTIALAMPFTPMLAAMELKSGIGYVLYAVWAIGLICAAALGVAGGMGFNENPTQAKLKIAGAVLIPIILGILQYIFKSALKLDIQASDQLSCIFYNFCQIIA